jgi:AraC-like DNA-binding protein
MSRNGFLQLFSREIGVAPQTYSRKWHLNEACMLLHFGDTPIKEIAVSAGFYDRYHFTRAFKKEFGVGPAEYRKGHKSL